MELSQLPRPLKEPDIQRKVIFTRRPVDTCTAFPPLNAQVFIFSAVNLPGVYSRQAFKGTIRWVHVILNHRPVKSRFNYRPHGSERSDWSLRRPRPLSVHCSSRDRERCRLTCARSASKNA